MTTEKQGPVLLYLNPLDYEYFTHDEILSGEVNVANLERIVSLPITPDGSVGGLTKVRLEALGSAMHDSPDKDDRELCFQLFDTIQAILDQVKEPTP